MVPLRAQKRPQTWSWCRPFVAMATTHARQPGASRARNGWRCRECGIERDAARRGDPGVTAYRLGNGRTRPRGDLRPQTSPKQPFANVAAEADESAGNVRLSAARSERGSPPALPLPRGWRRSFDERRFENCLLGGACRYWRMHTAEAFEPRRPLRAGFAHTMIGQESDEPLLELQPRKSGDDAAYRRCADDVFLRPIHVRTGTLRNECRFRR